MMVQSPIKVGLVGEDPNDADAIKALLVAKFKSRPVQFIKLGERIMKGNQLDTEKARKIIGDDFRVRRPDFVVVTRDLDALESNTAQRAKRDKWFDLLNEQALASKGLFLLHIYELEALIAAHPEVFNHHYGAKYTPPGDVMHIEDPKGKLRDATRKCRSVYHPNHSPELLGKVSYDRLVERCRYFKAFDKLFTARLDAHSV